MIVSLLVLLSSAALWLATLWWLLAPDFSRSTHLGVLALHAVPPILVWLMWTLWRRQVCNKTAQEAQGKEAAAQAERHAVREAAQKKHEESVRQRRFACDCRVVSVVGVTGGDAVPDTLNLEQPAVHVDVEARETHLPVAGGEPALDRLAPTITDVLTTLYSTCGASMAFPLFVLPPAEVSGEEVMSRLRAVHSELAVTLYPDMRLAGAGPLIRFLPNSDCAANSVLAIFDSIPDLPGAVVLAFDSPLSRAAPDEEGLDDEGTLKQLRILHSCGAPSEAVVALLLTNPELPSMLATVSQISPAAQAVCGTDSMTPFWNNVAHVEGNLAMLACSSAALRVELAHLPVLGRVHRAVLRHPKQARTGVLEMTRLAQGALEQAQINAGLIDTPFVFDDAPSEQTGDALQQAPANRCGCIVHNAGGVDVAGRRLAALGSALYYFDIDVNPVDAATATNIVTDVGDTGQAAGIVQLALGIAHAARQVGPVLCAEFSADDGVAASFVMPAPDNTASSTGQLDHAA